MELTGLDHLVLCVRDVAATIAFYERVLGMAAREERPGKWSLHAGPHKISLQDAVASPSIAAIALAFGAVNWEVGLMVVGYGTAQVAYSLGLKQIVIVDVMTLVGLFILRVAAGASAVDAHASEWLILCTGMGAAFLGFTKRRQEAVSELHHRHPPPGRSSSTTRCRSSTRWSPWSPPEP